jgi:hypothetical protein
MYLSDSDDNLPMANYPNTPGNLPSAFSYRSSSTDYVAWNWADIIQPYVKNYNVFKCPDDTSGPLIVGGVAIPGYPLSYALNMYIYLGLAGFPGFLGTTGAPMSEILTPSTTLFIVESNSSISQELVDPVSTKRVGLNRHVLGSNYVYADTHAHFHVMPPAWTTIPDATWKSPVLAQTTGYNQWFPWIGGDEKW